MKKETPLQKTLVVKTLKKRNSMQHDAIKKALAEHFKSLPEVIQRAITDATVEARMQKLSGQYKLHFDQWQKLEYEVLMALYGVTPMESIEENIAAHIAVDAETAQTLARDITAQVFEPIRATLERALEHPEALPKEGTPVEDLTAEILAQKPIQTPTAPPPLVQKPTLSDSYKTGEPSTVRKHIDNDPYREPVS